MQTAGTLNQADKGRAWGATNTTVGTGIAGPAVTAFSDTSALFALANASASPPAKIIWPDYIQLLCTAAPGAGATSLQFAVTLDNIPRGVTSNVGCILDNQDSDGIVSAKSIAFAQFGALTPSAASANRVVVARGVFKTQATPCLSVGDTYTIAFNGIGDPGFGLMSGAGAARYVNLGGAVQIGAGGLMLLHIWIPGNTGAPSFEFDAQWWELS